MTQTRAGDDAAAAAVAAAVASEPPAEPPASVLPMTVDVRSIALVVLAVLACVFVLRWAKPVFVPLMLGVMFSYALSPIVDALVRWRVPRVAAAGTLMIAILGGLGTSAWLLADDAEALIESLPEAAQRLRVALRPAQGEAPGAIEKVKKAAAEIERTAQAATQATPAPAQRGVQRVQIEQPKFDVRDYLWSGTVGLLALVGQTIVVCFITFFLLLSGDRFRRKLVKIAGPTFTQKKLTVQALDEITAQMQRYMLVQLTTSVVVGVATWLAFLWLGLEHAAVWGFAAGVLNLVPYIGAIAVTAGSMLVGFMQFGTLEMALVVGAVSFVINSLEGYLLNPWLTSRMSRMNGVVVFVGVLAWGWLWGVWGLLLGIPILMVVKSVCDRVDDLKPVGELLGD
jgi:predicted PurR-regulated permease PerM